MENVRHVPTLPIFYADHNNMKNQSLLLMNRCQTLPCRSRRGIFPPRQLQAPNQNRFLFLDSLQIEHIHGHSQEPFSDFADWLARTERRQRLSMEKWRSVLPHLWTLFSSDDGLPPVCALGPHAPAPRLPIETFNQDDAPASPARTVPLTLTFNMSFCTANIASMYNGEWGHAGKTAYLRQLFLAMRLLFLGLQEARTPETFSCAEGVIRFASGH